MDIQGGFSLLHLAASSNGSKTLKFLLEKCKESPNQICNEADKATALHFAVLSNQQDNVRMLLKYGANPNSVDSMNNTALHYAVANENIRIVRILDDFGADGNIKNEDGICAIEISLNEDFKEIKMYFMGKSKYKSYDFTGVIDGVYYKDRGIALDPSSDQDQGYRPGTFTSENTAIF
jgi:ankyrin repeat protein